MEKETTLIPPDNTDMIQTVELLIVSPARSGITNFTLSHQAILVEEIYPESCVYTEIFF